VFGRNADVRITKTHTVMVIVREGNDERKDSQNQQDNSYNS